MLVPRTWRQAVVASIAAAATLFAGGSASAQDYVAHEDDAVLLQLQVQKYRLLDEIRGYQTPAGVCVDLADVIQSLELPVRVDKKSRRATGWIFAEDQAFTIDRDSNTVQIVNTTRPLQPGELYDTPEGWCVDTQALAGWFGVTLQANIRNSTLVLTSERPLPFIEAIERESRAARLRPERDRDLSAYPQAAQPYALWRMPSVDVMARTDFRSTGRRRVDTRYEIFASGEIARASVDMRLASDQNGAPESLRLRAYRMDPDAGLLGPIKATQLIAGDVDLFSGSLAGASGVGRGVFLSNRPLQRATRFGTTVLRGTLPLGWDAELYRNGQLLVFQNDAPDGRYEFEVNLLYGKNDLEVVLYGPQGQIRRESQSIPVGFGAVPPGKLEYWAGVIQRNRDLISFGRPASGGADRGWQYAAGVQYGLDRSTVVGASGHSLFLDGHRRDYAELNLQRAVGPMLLNLTAAQEIGRGRAYRAELIGKIAGINVQAESFFIDGGFRSGLVGERESSAHRIQFDTVVRAGRLAVPLSGGFRRTTQRDGRQVDELVARASLSMPRMALTGTVSHRVTRGGGDSNDGTRIGMLANTRFLGLSVRGEATYRLTGRDKGLESASLSLERSLDDRSDLSLNIEHLARGGTTSFDAGYVRHFRKFALRGGGRVDSNGGLGGSLTLSFSLGPDPLRGGWRLSREKLAERGQAAVAVFLDANGDGHRSPDEPALPGIGVNAGQGSADPTDEAGHAFVEGLQPYRKVLVSIDESTLPDPFLMPRTKGLVVMPRPGIATVIELAVAPTGEVEGTIIKADGTPLPGAELELVDARGQVAARAMSEYDGFFLFDRVPYGRYELHLADASRNALGLPAELASRVEVSAAEPVGRLGTIRLRASATLAQARVPPALAASP